MKSEMDVELEVLAAIMFDAEKCTYAFETIIPEHFVRKEHREIYQTMCDLYESGESVDLITLSSKSKHEDILMDIATISHTAAHIKSHTNILVDRWYLLEARKKLKEAQESLKEKDRSPATLRERCEEIAYFLSDRTVEKGLQHISDVGTSAMKNIEEIQQGKIFGVKTGFKDLDDMGFYLRYGSLTVVAARPAMGKSALALAIAKNANVNTAIFSLEMDNEEQYERFISMKTGLTNYHLKKPDVLTDYASDIIDAAGEINKQKIWLNDSPNITTSMIASQCRRLKAQHGLELVIIDYLGLAKTEQKFSKRHEEVGYISKSLKRMAKNLGVAVLPLAQLNRKLEDRTDKRPILSDLRESGDLEQDAHVVAVLYREEVYNEECDEPEKAEFIIRKNRSGPVGTVYLTFKKQQTKFVTYEKPTSHYIDVDDIDDFD